MSGDARRARALRRSPPTSPSSPTRLPPCRSTISDRSRPPRNKARLRPLSLKVTRDRLPCSLPILRGDFPNLLRKEKRAACESKRPKSREETPKEGSDSARRYRTAKICDRAAQSASLLKALSP